MATVAFQDLRVYQLAEQVADILWAIVKTWDRFATQTVGEQLIRSADSIGANIAEGNGRHSHADNRRFVLIARGSLYETQHWLRRAYARGLLTPDHVAQLKPLLDELAPKLNAYRNALAKKIPKPKQPPPQP